MNFKFITKSFIRNIWIFLDSSAVEQLTVNQLVAGSNPARGATNHFLPHPIRSEKRTKIKAFKPFMHPITSNPIF